MNKTANGEINNNQEDIAMTNAITRVEIEDFLVFKGKFAADFCPGVNVLIGGNGTGKTTLIREMYRSTKHSLEHFESPLVTQGTFNLRYSGEKVRLPLDVAIPHEMIDSVSDEDAEFYKTPKEELQYAMRTVNDNSFYEGYKCVFIPEKDILEHAKGLLTFIEQKQTGFSQIYKDVLVNAQDIPTNKQTKAQKSIGKTISNLIGGEVKWDKGDGSFYTIRTDGTRIPFANEASGFKKFGYLGLLVACGQLESGTILFWDEPENSLNPGLIPKLVDILLELSRNGVQVFVATHSYDVARWFELKKNSKNKLRYFNLRKEKNSVVEVHADEYTELEKSVLRDADNDLLKAVMGKSRSGEK
jgi:predicted ATPase